MLQVEQVLQERYQLKQQLGNNAGRQTWLAVDLATTSRERVIVKLLPFSPQLHWDDLKLFEREAQVLKHLNHPSIPKYRDYFSTKPSNSDELPWFGLVQDYIPGDSLQQFLNKGKRFTEAGVKEIAIQLLEILIYLHELSPAVLHRDIKPSNIIWIWGKNRQVYLVDFGAVQEKAKAEGATFTVVGTGGYAPPEQLWGKAVPASDLYALGATLIHLLTGTAPGDLPQRQMRLQFRDKVSLTLSFAHWLETLTHPDPELRFSNARAALLALQASGSPSSSLLTAATGSEGTNRKARQSLMNKIAVLLYVMAFLSAIALPEITPRTVQMFKQAEGRQNVAAMNRAQQAYFLESNEFADSVPEVGIGIKTQTENYEYSIRATPLTAFEYGVSRKGELKSYVGGVFITSGDEAKGEILTVELVCETKSRGTKRPAEPVVLGNFVECPPNTKLLNTTTDNDTGRIVLRKNSALAYHSLNYAVAGQYDKALQVAKTIKHPHFKARALAAVAHQLAAKGQYNQALEIAKTITDRSGKQIALKAIAVQLAAKGQYNQALELAKTLTDDSVKQRAMEAIAVELAAKGQYNQALELAKTLTDDSVKQRAMEAIAVELAAKGQYNQALELAKTLTDDSVKQRAMEAIAPNLTTEGQYDRVLKIAATIKDDSAKAQVLQAIAPNLTSAGQYDQALKIAKTIKDDSARTSALQALNLYRKSS